MIGSLPYRRSALSSISNAASPTGFLLSGTIRGFTGTNNLFLACAVAGMMLVAISLLFTDVASVDQHSQQATEQIA
jgi:hypothetical protein